MSGKILNEIICGDALDVLKKFQSETIDLAVLDPPYLVSAMHNVSEDAKTSVESITPEYLKNILSVLFGLLKMNSALLFFGHLSTFIEYGGLIKSLGFKYVTDIVWVKPNIVNFMLADKKPLSRHETITVWTKNSLRFNAKESREVGKLPSFKSDSVKTNTGELYDYKRYGQPRNYTSRCMSDVIEAPSKPYMSFNERTPHPTQKPLKLMEKLVLAFSFRGDVVLDPFCGSGTTCVACKKHLRNYIGIDINPKYCEIANKRLAAISCQRLDKFFV